MNIFVLHSDPTKAARMHCDTHCSKMILESAQMLSTAAHFASGKLKIVEKANGKKGYHISGTLSGIYGVDVRHVFHPCTLWTLSSRSCAEWLLELAEELHTEKLFRTNRGHKSIDVVRKCRKHILRLEDAGLIKHALAMPDRHKCASVVTSYRSTYIHEKAHLLEYTRRDPPAWLAKHFIWQEQQVAFRK